MGKKIFFLLADLTQGLHDDLALLLGGQRLHNGRLDNGHQGHVGIRRHGDGAQQGRGQQGGDEDGRGAVRAADDTHGGRLCAGEAQQTAAHIGQEDAQLGRSAQQQALGVGDQGTKVGHGAHAHENKAGIDAQLDTQVQHIDQTNADSDITEGNAIGGKVLLGSYQGVQLVGQRAHGLGAAGGKLCHQVIEHTGVERTLRRRHQGVGVRLEHIGRYAVCQHFREELCRDGLPAEQVPVDVSAGEQDLVEHLRAGQVRHQHTECDGYQQQRLKLLDDTQKQQHNGNDQHNGTLPVVALEKLVKAGAYKEIGNSFHVQSSGVSRWCTAARRTPRRRPWSQTRR